MGWLNKYLDAEGNQLDWKKLTFRCFVMCKFEKNRGITADDTVACAKLYLNIA